MIEGRVGSGTKTRRFYDKYRNYILFNKNIILSGTVAFFIGALSTQLYAQNDSNNLVNSLVTLSIEYGIYIPLFAILFYMDNKQRYIDPVTQKKDYSIIKGDVKKMIAAIHYLGADIFCSKVINSLRITPEQYRTIPGIDDWRSRSLGTIFSSDKLGNKSCKTFSKLKALSILF